MTKLTRYVLVALIAAIGGVPMWSLASGPSEPVRKMVKISYSGDGSIAVDCRHTGCAVVVVLDRKKYAFGAADLRATPIAADATLYSERSLPRTFSFEVQIECPFDEAEPPFHVCFGNFLVREGKIAERTQFSREVGRDTPLN